MIPLWSPPSSSSAADDALAERDLLARDIRADRREHALHAGARIGRAAHDPDGLAACVDDADSKPLGVGMRLRFDDPRDDEPVILDARILDALHFEADAGQRFDDF